MRLTSSRTDLVFLLGVLSRFDGAVQTLSYKPSRVCPDERELELTYLSEQSWQGVLARLLEMDCVREATVLYRP